MNKKSKIKLIVILIALLIILAFFTTAQFSTTVNPKIIGPITNDGSVNINSKIIFNAKCDGINTKLIVCKDNAICNLNSQQKDIICNSQFSNKIEKSCTYKTTKYDEGSHNNDIATC